MDEAAPPTPTQPRQPTVPTGDGPERRSLLIVAILALVAIAGIVAWSIGNDDATDRLGREEERFPSPTTQPPPTTVPTTPPSTVPAAPAPTEPALTVPATTPPTPATEPPTTPPPSTAAPTVPATAPPSTAPPTVPPTSADAVTTTPDEPEPPDIVTRLVPNVAAYAEYLATPEQAQAAIGELLVNGRHDVATLGPADTICAAVPLDEPLAVDTRWERDGRRITSSELGRREAPGFGECLGNDGDPLEDGSYQFVAIDSRGNESAAGGIVIGAVRIDQIFRNPTAEPVCSIRVAPERQPLLRGVRLHGVPDPARTVRARCRRRRPPGRRAGRVRARRPGPRTVLVRTRLHDAAAGGLSVRPRSLEPAAPARH